MNTQKRARPKRLLSLLLTVVMLLGVLPLSAVSVGAETEEQSGATAMLAATNGLNEDLPTWDPNPKWELIKDVFVQDTRLYLLRDWLGSNTVSTSERYIRLTADIEVSEAYLKDNEKIVVNGKKVLDLNGHTISIKLGKGAGYDGRQTAITVNKDATLMVIDSKGGGKIFGDSWICAPTDMRYNRASTDLFYNKGTLIINIPNGEIETGRSKKQWVTAASKNGVKETLVSMRYTGYIRGQSNGSAIIGSEDSTTVIVSGRVIGRGFYKFGESQWGTSTDTPYQRCTAVRTDGTFIMYGGEIYGMGGANVLSTSYKSDVMIYSGYFRTTTIDKMAIAADKQEDLTGYHANYTEGCEYGSIGVKGIATDAEYFNGKHDATVRPKSVTDMTSDSIVITQNYGANIIDPRTMDHWYVYADYTPYYPLAARNYIGNGGYTGEPYGYDYKLSTTWKARAEFTVLDSKGNVVGYGDERNWLRDEPNRSVFRCDVLACKEKDGSAISWISVETYTLRCKITESWGGDPEQKRTVYQDMVFTIWDKEMADAAKSMDFEFTPTTSAKGAPTSFLISLKESCFDVAKANFITKMDVRYNYYEPTKNAKGEITGYEKKTETAATYADIIRKNAGFGSSPWFIGKDTVLKPKAAGPLEVAIDMYTSSGHLVDTKTYNIFAMPALTGRFLSSEKYAVPADGYTMEAQYSAWKAYMNSGIRDFAAMTDYSVSSASVIWQYRDLETNAFVDIASGDARFTFEENNNIFATNRTGEYRASYQFQGTRYYSPRTILVIGINYSNTRRPYIDASRYAEYGENARIGVSLNADADWKGVQDYTLFCRSYPSAAILRNTQVTKTSNQFTLEGDFLYRSVTKETFVPGDYVFEAKVRHADGVATTARFVITYGVTSTGFTFTVNGDKAERLSTGDGKYRTLPTDDGIFRVGYALFPANASEGQYPASEFNYTYVNLTSDIISLANDGTATILAPGDAKIQLKITRKSNGEVVASPTLTVSVPVVGFEVEEPNYNDYLGDYWSNVKATVKSVWGPGGRKITTGADQYVAVSLRGTQGTGIGRTVKYDDIGGIVWNVQTKAGYQFPMEVIESYYTDNGDVKITCRADVTKIQTNAFTDTVKTAREHGSYGTAIAGERYVYTVGGTDGDPTSAIFTVTSKNAHVKNPNTKYIDVISISTGSPAVGDPRYEGTDSKNYYDEYLTVDLGSLSGLLRADGSCLVSARTWVSKLNSVKGSGKPYDNAISEDKTEYWKVWNYSGNNMLTGTPLPPTKKYEAGIYVNQLRLEIRGADENGDQYRFAPEVKLFVNGHLIEFANTTYSSQDYCFLTADYYFDVGDVTQYTSATVDATDITPTVGTKPKGIDSVSVEGTNDIEVTKLLWFVDANGNGKYDFGEEASVENGTLNNDGTFMANKKYSVDLEVGVADGAEGRLATPFVLKIKYDDSFGTVRQTKTATVSSVDPNGVFTFPYNYITQVDETVTAPADGKYTKYTSLIHHKTTAIAEAKGYTLSAYQYINMDGSNVEETDLIPGKQYRYDVTFMHRTDESWFAPPLMHVTLDGVTLSTTASDTEPWYEAWSNTMTIHYFFTVPSPGYTVYGAATSFGSQTDDVTIQLIESGASEAAYEAVVQGNSIGYAIENVVPGTYTMKVMKQNHVTREYSITVGTENVKQDVKIHLKGDINGDGKITMVDSAKANSHARGVALLTGYELKCADVVANDGNVTMADAGRINAHAKGMSKLW